MSIVIGYPVKVANMGFTLDFLVAVCSYADSLDYLFLACYPANIGLLI